MVGLIHERLTHHRRDVITRTRRNDKTAIARSLIATVSIFGRRSVVIVRNFEMTNILEYSATHAHAIRKKPDMNSQVLK